MGGSGDFGKANARVSTPEFQSFAPELLPDYRWMGWSRALYVLVFVPVLVTGCAMVWVTQQAPTFAIFVTIVVAVGVAVIVSGSWFRWSALRRSAERDALDRAGEVLFLYSRLALDRSPNSKTLLRRPGWGLLEAGALTVWEADSGLAWHSTARLVVEIRLSDVHSCRRKTIAAGRAFSRLEIVATGPQVLDVAVVPRNGSSIMGVSDKAISEIVTRVRSLARLQR